MFITKSVNRLKWLNDQRKPCIVKNGDDFSTHFIVRIPIGGNWLNTIEIATPRENIAELPAEYSGLNESDILQKLNRK